MLEFSSVSSKPFDVAPPCLADPTDVTLTFCVGLQSHQGETLVLPGAYEVKGASGHLGDL